VGVVTATEPVDRLALEAARAARVRAYQSDPDVVALRVERVRTQVDVLLWAGIILGLAFTMTNVQQFAAGAAPGGGLVWWSAWLLDPMVSLVLLAILRAEQVTARYQVPMNAWATRTKWLTFAATYVMNTWASFAQGHTAGVVLHSVPPLVVFFAAATGPGLRDRLTQAVTVALTTPPTTEPVTEPVTQPVDGAVAGVPGNVPATVPPTAQDKTDEAVAGVPGNVPATAAPTAQDKTAEPVGGFPTPTMLTTPGTGGQPTEPVVAPPRVQPVLVREVAVSSVSRRKARKRRMFVADYIAMVTPHHRPATVVTPVWVREHAPGIGRATSVKVAALLNATPDPDQLSTTEDIEDIDRNEDTSRGEAA
jgi:hypothetical protein